MVRISVGLVIFLLSSFALAERFKIENVSVQEVIVYNDHGHNVVTVKFEPENPISTGCLPTDEHNMVSYWTTGGVTSTMQSWVSILLSAQAQSLNVDLYVEGGGSACNTSSSWDEYGTPYGLGRSFWGAKIRTE